MGLRRIGPSAKRAARNRSAVRWTKSVFDASALLDDAVADCVVLRATSGVAAGATLRAACGIGGPDKGAGRTLIGGGAGMSRRTAGRLSTADPAGGAPRVPGAGREGDDTLLETDDDIALARPGRAVARGSDGTSMSKPPIDPYRRRNGTPVRSGATVAARGGSVVAYTTGSEPAGPCAALAAPPGT
jgi:hypothetical protein